jgi:hypothetical protein
VKAVLVIATATAILGVAACDRARSASYFVAHANERQAVLAGCTSGSVRGRECDTAAAAAATAKHQEAEDYFRSSIGSK